MPIVNDIMLAPTRRVLPASRELHLRHFSSRANEGNIWTVETLDPMRVHASMDERVNTQGLHLEVLKRVRANQVRMQASPNKGTSSNLEVREYMMVARFSPQARGAERASEYIDGWCLWLIASMLRCGRRCFWRPQGGAHRTDGPIRGEVLGCNGGIPEGIHNPQNPGGDWKTDTFRTVPINDDNDTE